jgi:hypothetical protein
MLTTLITIATIFSVILATHNYVLEAMHKDALSEPKSRTDITD